MTTIETLLPCEVLDVYKACGVEPLSFMGFREKFPRSMAARSTGWFEAFYEQQYDFIAINEHSMNSLTRLALHELVHWTGHRSRLARERMLTVDMLVKAGFMFYEDIPTDIVHTEEVIAELGMVKLTKRLGLFTPEIDLAANHYISLHRGADLYRADIESDTAVEFILSQKQIRFDLFDRQFA